MIDAGVTPKTLGWPDRCRTWFYVHGGKLDLKTWEIIEKANLKTASDALLKAIADAQKGLFHPDRRERQAYTHPQES